MAVSAELLNDAKDKLRITWVEDDARISKLIESARADLDGLCGGLLDYDVESKAKTLLLEHVFYNWNNSLHDFRKNYHDELLELRLLTVIRKDESSVLSNE